MEKKQDKAGFGARNGDRAKRLEKQDNMHDNIGHWCDCCSCEAEPQWQEAAEKLGIDLSDRENS